ncbi:TPA: LysR family transcriptional regulator [Providencia rettgeri]
MMSLPDLNLLFALNALIENSSVNGAAQTLNLSSSAMSRTLSRIRETLDDPILVQAGRKMVLTPKAIAMQQEVKQALNNVTELLSSDKKLDLSMVSRRFTVRANDIFLAQYGEELIEAVAHELPNSILCFTPEEDSVDVDALRSGQIDLYISAQRPLAAEICVQHLFDTHFVGVVREGHPILQSTVTCEQFVKWKHIVVSRRGKQYGPVDEQLSQYGLERQVAMILPTAFSALFATLKSDYILVIPTHLADNAILNELKVTSFPLPFLTDVISIVQAWHPQFQRDIPHQWLRRKIRLFSESIR